MLIHATIFPYEVRPLLVPDLFRIDLVLSKRLLQSSAQSRLFKVLHTTAPLADGCKEYCRGRRVPYDQNFPLGALVHAAANRAPQVRAHAPLGHVRAFQPKEDG